MKAIVYHNYGSFDKLKLEKVQKPIPGDDQVLIKVFSASANPLDLHLLNGEPRPLRLTGIGVLKPKNKILGADVAGRVEAVGKNVTSFKIGDEVFGESYVGAYGEYVCVNENKLVPKPANITFDEAAAIPVAAITALQGLRDKGKIQSGQKVLINGASGGVGTFAIQIAKSFGAEVTGVCSTRNLEMVRSIGADKVIDYTQEDFVKSGQKYDLILDTAANRSMFEYKRVLESEGAYVMVGYSPALIFQVMFLGSLIGKIERKIMAHMGTANVNRGDLLFLKELVEAGKLVSVIDRHYPLSEVAKALQYLDQKHARGKVVISVNK